MSVGAAAGAAARRAERKLIEHFKGAEAVIPASACALPDLRWMGKRVSSRLIRAGAIREAGTGYYLDEVVYDAYRARRRQNTIIMVGTALLVSIATILLVWWVAHS